MLLVHGRKKLRWPVRVAAAHFDPKFYFKLEAGDEVVLYASDHKTSLDTLERIGQFLADRQLVLQECANDTTQHTVWVIVDARTGYGSRAAE